MITNAAEKRHKEMGPTPIIPRISKFQSFCTRGTVATTTLLITKGQSYFLSDEYDCEVQSTPYGRV